MLDNIQELKNIIQKQQEEIEFLRKQLAQALKNARPKVIIKEQHKDDGGPSGLGLPW